MPGDASRAAVRPAMTLQKALRRVALAGLICGVITIVMTFFLAGGIRLVAAGDAFNLAHVLGAAIWCLVFAFWYAAGLLMFGLPLLWLWPDAFQRRPWRCIAATTLGAMVPVAAGVAFDEIYSEWLWIACAALASFVWWCLNSEVAAEKSPID